MPRPDLAIATHAARPEPAEDDQRSVDLLERRGWTVEARPWSDSRRPWTEAPLVVVRSTWDYPRRRTEFLRWIGHVERHAALHNPGAVLRWNTDKSYLRRLARQGVPVVPTREIRPGEGRSWARIVRGLGEDRVVVKPRVSADGYLTEILGVDDAFGGLAHLRRVLAHGPALVQPYLPAVEARGERSLVYLDGRYSHAVRRTPILSPGGRGGPEPAEVPPRGARRVADIARVAAGATRLLYARADVVPDATGRYRLLELELTEPTLYLDKDPRAARRFADAIERRLLRLTPRRAGGGTARRGPRRARPS